MIIPHLYIARAHWALGALFLVVILEEYLPRPAARGGAMPARSLIVPWGLMAGGVGVWATTVFTDVVHDMLVHSLWGDILFAAGALELARRRGVFERRWSRAVLPAAFLSCGLLFIFHEQIHSTGAGDRWHVAMGVLLIAGGGLELIVPRRDRATRVPLSAVPLIAFALTLIAIPVAAAS
jgi:hypothetical protein